MRHLKLIPTLTLFLILTACTNPVTHPDSHSPASTPLAAVRAPSPTCTLAPTITPAAQLGATSPAVVTVAVTPPPVRGHPTPSPVAVAATPGQPTPPPPSPTVTPAGPQLVLAANANIRRGPGTAYPVIGGAQRGRQFPITGHNGVTDPAAFATAGWWQVVLPGGGRGWIWAGLGVANIAPDQIAEAPYDPPPTATATPLPPTAIPAPTPAPAVPEIVVLGSDTIYPVRARRFIGDGYEFVDASSQYDLELHRDIYGAVAREFWGDRLYGKHPAGIRITLIDPEAPAECAIVCKSCPGQPTIARHLAPVRLSNDWRGDCHARSLAASYGDGQGGAIWVGCAYDSDDALGIQTDPEQCFVAIAAPGPHLTDLLVSATITTFNWLVVQNYGAMTPDFTQGPFTPALGQAHKEGDQWRWEDPFLEVRLVGG